MKKSISTFYKYISFYSFSLLPLYLTPSITFFSSLPLPINDIQPPSSLLQQKLISFSKLTKDLYQQTKFNAIWHLNSIPLPLYHQALDILAHADSEGLDPQDYKVTLTTDWVENELNLTQAFLNYISDVKEGRLPLSERGVSFIPSSRDPFFAITFLLNSLKDKANYKNLYQIPPNDSFEYAALKKSLAQIKELRKVSPNWPTIQLKKPIKPGMEHELIPTIHQLLIIWGDLDGHTFSQEQKESTKYDPPLVEAVKHFQSRYTLAADGILSAETAKALSEPPEKLIRKITLAMERLRWLPWPRPQRFLLVNVGGYDLTAINQGKVELRMPIIVGKVATRTPLFASAVKSIILNPSWTVPEGIMRRDKLHRIQNDPEYLHRAGFTVTDSSGHTIDPQDADWDNAGMSYHLHQGPGRHNALGRVKFNIPNPYTIYLHGTPDENLFSKSVRTFSSGCIRLKDPILLAQWVLEDPKSWSVNRLQEIIDKSKSKTQTLTPSQELPVYFTYLTAWVDETGKVHFSPDAYKLDGILEKKLEKRKKK